MKKTIITALAISVVLITGCKSSTSNSTASSAPTKVGNSAIVTIKPTPKATLSPTHKVTPVVLITESGSNENINSKPFNIGTRPVSVSYSYSNCPYNNGNFIADLITSGVSQDSLSYEDINISNAIGSGGNVTTNEYPQNPGTEYYLSINTECNFTITVTSEG